MPHEHNMFRNVYWLTICNMLIQNIDCWI